MYKAIISLFIALIFGGCSMLLTPQERAFNKDSEAVKFLIKKASLSDSDRLIVATFYDIDDLEKSSTFGRSLTENVIKNFVDNGIKVYEIKLRKNLIYVKKKEGEFALTRNIKKLARFYKANYIVVGTYKIGREIIYVNLKVIDPKTSIIVASYDYTVDRYNRI